MEILLLSMKTCMLSLLNSKGKSLSYIGTTHCLVKRIELLKVWSRSTKAQLKPVHVLVNMYFLMSPYDQDELCEWVRNKRSFFN